MIEERRGHQVHASFGSVKKHSPVASPGFLDLAWAVTRPMSNASGHPDQP
jgi:hypothetical protein